MASILFANDAKSTLAGTLSNVGTSLTLATGTGALFPNPTGGDYFMMTLIDAPTGLIKEILKVTARSGDVCTVVRAQEGTSAQTWAAGSLAINLITAGTMGTIEAQSLTAANALPLTGGALTGPVTSSSTIQSSGGFSGALTGNVTGNVSGSSGSCTGNAATASVAATATTAAQLVTARTIAATGDVTWSVTFQGNANVSASATIANQAVTFAKMQAMANATVIGNISGFSNTPNQLSMPTLAAMLGNTSVAGGWNLPGGFQFRSGNGSAVNGGIINFTTPFTNACFVVSVYEGNPSSWDFNNLTTMCAQFWDTTKFALFGERWNGSAWTPFVSPANVVYFAFGF